MNFLVNLHNNINKVLAKDSFIYIFNNCIMFLTFVFVLFLYFSHNEYNNAFIRSGVIMILFGVIIEYTLSKIKTYSTSNSVYSDNHTLLIEKTLENKYINQKMIAHFMILFGTLIWGFADILPASFYLFR